jgi:predicted transcriptional regulator
MAEKPKIETEKMGLSAPAICSEVWCVRFKVKDKAGHFTPVWWGKKGAGLISLETVEKLAKQYLKEHREFVSSIDEIYKV